MKEHHQHSTNIAFILMLCSGCIVGIGPILAKSIHQPAISIVLYRILLPIPFLLIMRKYARKYSFHSSKITSKAALLMSVIGILFALDLITFYLSLKLIAVAPATLIANLSPVIISAYLLMRQKRLSHEIIWPCVAMIGLILLCGFSYHSTQHFLLGNLAALLSAVFFTGYILLINKLGKNYHSIDIMLWSSGSGALLLLLVCIVFGINIHITSHYDLMLLLAMSLGTQLIGQTMLTSAISRFSPTISSLGILIDPVAAAIFAFLIFHETLNLIQIAGAFLVLISILNSYYYNSASHLKHEETVNG